MAFLPDRNEEAMRAMVERMDKRVWTYHELRAVTKLFDSDLDINEKRELVKKKIQVDTAFLVKRSQKGFIGKSKARKLSKSQRKIEDFSDENPISLAFFYIRNNSYTVNDETHAGIMLYDDRDNVYLWGRYRSTIRGYNDFSVEKIVNDVGTAEVSHYASTSLPMYLGIRKTGATKYFTYSSASESFSDQYNTTELVGHNVGMFAKEWSGYTIDAPFEYFYVRRYMSSEPSAGSPGTEEVGTSPIAYWDFNEGQGTTVHNKMESPGEADLLLSWWNFDEASSGTSPSPQDLRGPVDSAWEGDASYTSTAKIGNAATFDGAGDYITAYSYGYDNHLDVDSNFGFFSIAAWVKTSTNGTVILCKSYSTTDCYGMGDYYNLKVSDTGKAVFEFNNGDDTVSATSSATMTRQCSMRSIRARSRYWLATPPTTCPSQAGSKSWANGWRRGTARSFLARHTRSRHDNQQRGDANVD